MWAAADTDGDKVVDDGYLFYVKDLPDNDALGSKSSYDLIKRTAGVDVVVATPEDIPGDLVVDRVWSNPPIRVGKAVLHELLERWLGQLAPAGSGHLVVQKHLGADSLHRWLELEGWAVHRRTSRKAFRLLDVTRLDAAL